MALGKYLVGLAFLFALSVPLHLLTLVSPDQSWPLFRLLLGLDTTLTVLSKAIKSPELYLLQAVSDAYFVKALAASSELDLADLLNTLGPSSCSTLSTRLKVDTAKLSHLLRFLESKGVFRKVDEELYANNEYSELIRKDGKLKTLLSVLAADSFPGLNFFNLSPETSSLLYESDFLGQLKKPGHTHLKIQYKQLISSLSLSCAQALVSELPWESFEGLSAVSVGGAAGQLLLTALGKQPRMIGTVFDSAENCIAFLRTNVTAGELSRRLLCESSKDFSIVPSGFDIYILDHLLMRHTDTTSLHLLHSISSAMQRTHTMDPGSQPILLIADLGSPAFPALLHAADFHLSSLVHGRVRTAKELHSLLVEAGLVIHRRIETKGLSVAVIAGLVDT